MPPGLRRAASSWPSMVLSTQNHTPEPAGLQGDKWSGAGRRPGRSPGGGGTALLGLNKRRAGPWVLGLGGVIGGRLTHTVTSARVRLPLLMGKVRGVGRDRFAMRSPRLLLLCAGLGSALLLALSTPLAAQHPLPPPPTATNVTAGGATATSVTQSGSTTNVTTGTVSGGNAYNQFSSFQVANGTTVNLNIPTAATNNNLLNLINDPTKTPTQIFGIVNSLLSDGSIGGNVYFADPNGVVIGATGAVNVGSLTLATPSSDFVANFFHDMAGNTIQLIAGTEPLTSDGLIAVLGQIHSVGPTS